MLQTDTTVEFACHAIYAGSKANNIVILKGGVFGLMHEPHDPNPDRRYKAVVWHDWRDSQGVPPEGYYLYTSPDGLRWTQEREQPVALNQNSHQSGIGDTSLFFWDDRLGRYVCYTKILFRGPTMRTSGMMESDDLLHWSRPRMIIYPDSLDDPDTQIYEHYGFYYESMWIGLMRVMHTALIDENRKQTVVELTASRDGRHFTRVGKRELLIPLGASDEWDPHYHAPTSPPILVGDELWIYYFSMPLLDAKKVGEKKARESQVSRIGLATIRRDGFVSLDAGDEPGKVVTRPLTFDGKQLYVNANVSEKGYLKAEFQDMAGKPVTSYRLSDCTPVQGDVLSSSITWHDRDQVRLPAGQSYRLVFELKNARLYSFWID